MVVVPEALRLLFEAIEREIRRAGRDAEWLRLNALAPRLPLSLRRVLFRGVHRRLGGRLRFVVSGGAPLEPELARKWETLGVPIVQGYGATEAAPVITGTSIAQRRLGSVGKPLPGQPLRIAEDGEVLIRGPNVASGYWRNPEATEAAFRDGWYGTGDLGELDAQGYLYLKGRKKDMIALPSGMNVYCEDVERELRWEPGVRDAAVLGVEAPAGPVRIHAVLLGPPTEADAETAVRAANSRLAPHQRVQDFSLWPGADLPRTPTLKVKKQEVGVWLHEGRREERSPPDPGNPLARLVARMAQSPQDRVTPLARLGPDLGLDSLARVELLAAIEAELGASIDEERVGETTTVGDLQTLLAQAGSWPRPSFHRWPLAPLSRTLRAALLGALAFPLLGFVCHPQAEGTRPDGLEGPCILAPNHSSHLDSLAVLSSLPARTRRRVAVAAAADYFFSRRWLGLVVSLVLNAFPFARVGSVRPTLEWCGRLVDEGWSILVFPEGTRSATGEIGPFRSGIGLMAVELEVPVVPIRLRGTYEALAKGRAWPKRGEVTVTFGRPLRFPQGSPYEEASRAIESAVRAL